MDRSIEIVAVTALATVQDAGRPGHMHEGVPHGGALVPELLARANAAVGNEAYASAIEVVGALAVQARGGPVLVASDDGQVHTIERGETRSVACRGARVRYLAARGGIDVPLLQGSRSTLLVAGFGGHEGRPLRKGDVLAIGSSPARDVGLPPFPTPLDLQSAIRVVAGPDLDRFQASALGTLVGSAFRISSRADRVGVRLVGPPLARSERDRADSDVSAPMVRGAIQVPPSGDPIVLGPDHPTTGGYPVIATVVRADLGNLMARSPGSPVHFTLA
jgi:5-oxoprolinase (ATP-hydrolysing) subunit C